MCITHRSLHASVGYVATDCYILGVFAAVKWHWSVLTLCNRSFSACALDTVHVDGTRTYKRGRGVTVN